MNAIEHLNMLGSHRGSTAQEPHKKPLNCTELHRKLHRAKMEIMQTTGGRFRVTVNATIAGVRVRKTKLLPDGLDEKSARKIGLRLFSSVMSTIDIGLAEMVDSPSDQGSVYIAVNAGLPGIVKIGMTRSSVSDRMRNLSTAQPAPWIAVGSAMVEHVAAVESLLHRHFNPRRIAQNREHFQMSTMQALDALRQCESMNGVRLAGIVGMIGDRP